MQTKSKKEIQSSVSISSPLKTFLETHPVVFFTTTILTTASVVAGVMLYLSNSRADLIGEEHKLEIANLIAKNDRDMNEKTNPLTKTIADLNFRLSSIERRLPGAVPAYLDVASMTIGPESVKALERQYTPFGGQDFFVAVPPMTDWSYMETNEFEYGLTTSQTQQPIHPLMKRLLENTKLYVWKGKPRVEIMPIDRPTAKLKQTTFNSYPTIVVKKIDSNAFRDRISVVEALTGEMEKVGNNLDDMLSVFPRVIENLNTALGELSTKMRAAGQNIDFQPIPVPQITSTRDERIALRRRTLDALTMFGSADLSSLMMMSVLSEFAEQIASGLVQHRILSAQKKGDVFYIQSQFTFNNVRVVQDPTSAQSMNKISIDQEVFFFSHGSEGFLVRTTLPPVANRAEAFSLKNS